MKTGYYGFGLGGGNKFCVVDSKKWISEEYLNEKLTLQKLWPPGVEVQSMLAEIIPVKTLAHSVFEITVRSTKLRVGLRLLEAVKCNK